MVHCAAYDCLTAVGRDKSISYYKFQADNHRRKQAIMAHDSRASLSKTTSKQSPKLLKSPGLDNLKEPAKNCTTKHFFSVLMKIKVGEFRGRLSLGLPFTKAELKLTHMAQT